MLPRPNTLEEWGRVFTDVGIWHKAVANILDSKGLSFTAVTAGFPGSNAVFLVDDALVVKIFAPMFEADYAKELVLYRLLANRQDIKAPTLVSHGYYNDGNAWPYLIMTYCQGTAIREIWQEMNPGQRQLVAEQLGKKVRALHGIGVKSVDISPLSWANFFQGRISSVIQALREGDLLAQEVVAELDIFLRSSQPSIASSDPALIHGDLTEDHLLLGKLGEEWSISGLIDFADAEIAPVEYEWVALWFGLLHCDPAAFQSFMSSYNSCKLLDENWRERMLAMTFLHRYGVPIAVNALGEQAKDVRTLDELKDALWPEALLH